MHSSIRPAGPRWLRLALWFAPLLLCTSLGALEGPPAPAPAIPPAEFVPVVDMRLNQITLSLSRLKSFLDTAASVGSIQAMYFIKNFLLHSSNLDGIDGTKTAHVLVFVPKALFTATAADRKALEGQVVVIQLVPLKKEQDYKDSVEADVEQIQQKDGYSTTTFPDEPFPLFFKIANGYAVFSPTQFGVDLGLAQAALIAAADQAAQEPPSFITEIRPQWTLNAAGITTDAKRTAVAAALTEQLKASPSLKQFAEFFVSPGARLTADTLPAAADQIMATLPLIESVQQYILFDKTTCSVGGRLKMIAGSPATKAIDAMKPLDPKTLCGLADADEYLTAAGTVDPVCLAVVQFIYARQHPASQNGWLPLEQALKDIIGHVQTASLAIDDQGLVTGGGEVNFNADTDIEKVIAALETDLQHQSDAQKAGGNLYFPLTSSTKPDQDGWKVHLWDVAIKSDNVLVTATIQDPQYRVVPMPMKMMLLQKPGRLVFASGPDEATALKRATEYAAQKFNTGLKPEYAALVAKQCQDHGISGVLLYNMYPVVKTLMARNDMPPVFKMMTAGLADSNPLMFSVFSKDHALHLEVLLEPTTAQQLAIVSAIAIPNLLASKIGTNQTAAVQNLKALATAQAQYIKKKDFYAISGTDLNASGMLIANDLKNAFQVWQKNGDAETPSPKAGYVFRMLQGDSADNLTSFYKDANDPTAGMNTWGATARPAEPGDSGENQFFISEAGTVYKHADTLDNTDPLYKHFLLDHNPTPDELEKLGWVPAR